MSRHERQIPLLFYYNLMSKFLLTIVFLWIWKAWQSHTHSVISAATFMGVQCCSSETHGWSYLWKPSGRLDLSFGFIACTRSAICFVVSINGWNRDNTVSLSLAACISLLSFFLSYVDNVEFFFFLVCFSCAAGYCRVFFFPCKYTFLN